MHKGLFVLLGVAGLATACADARPSALPPACYDYHDTIAPLLADSCTSCHGQAQAEGGYRLDSYPAILAPRQDGTMRVEAGNASSLLLLYAAGENGHPTAAAMTQETLARWVTTCNLSFFSSSVVHPEGWVNPTAADFHGRAIQAAGWSFDGCTTCHGEPTDVTGGSTGKSCTSCHAQGVTTCTTCHGGVGSEAPFRGLDGRYQTSASGAGAHALHLAGGPILDKPVACEGCHVVPTDWKDVGHIFQADGSVDPDPRAEVTFSGLATASLAGHASERTGDASYAYATQSCSGIYCHAGALAAQPADPVWTAGSAQSGCATCHAIPPGGDTHFAGLALTDCADCHGQVADGDGAIANTSMHIDAELSLGDGTTSCTACHGTATANDTPLADAAPPPGPGGDASADAAGKHQEHVRASTYDAPIACAECHTQPPAPPFATEQAFLAAVTSPGHIDHEPEAVVFPGGATFTGLAAARGFVPTYDPSTGACTNYCHSYYNSTGIDWTGTDTVGCGSCHGAPSSIGAHSGLTLPADANACNGCHANTVNPDGTIHFAADGTTCHIDGAKNCKL